ncbi:hypothetical protein C0993_009959 [Termitomyces sp. T159_Od127]|nr:hypothetical protein C0993_009959 [Termitomyces sp. T159_Od127]
MLVSRVPVYRHIIISLFSVLLIQAFPSWIIAKPPVREFKGKHRSASVTSSTSTLIDPNEVVALKKEVDEAGKEAFVQQYEVFLLTHFCRES